MRGPTIPTGNAEQLRMVVAALRWRFDELLSDPGQYPIKLVFLGLCWTIYHPSDAAEFISSLASILNSPPSPSEPPHFEG